jgi:hypothetical protein
VSTQPGRGSPPVPPSPVPPLLVGFVDDAAVFPPGSAALPDAVVAHRAHRAAWYAPMVGPLLLTPDHAAAVPARLAPGEVLGVGLIGPLPALRDLLPVLPAGLALGQVEAPVALRGEDPLPGLRALVELLGQRPGLTGYAEIPLAWGLHAALDMVAEERARGVAVVPKFRTGGLVAELFPSPAELAAVVCACRDRGLPFKLTAGLHHAVRHTDPTTGFTHHGFLNVLVAAAVAADGGGADAVTDVLAAVDAVPLVQEAGARRDRPRPLWTGFGTCSIDEPLTDLAELGLLTAPEGAPA